MVWLANANRARKRAVIQNILSGGIGALVTLGAVALLGGLQVLGKGYLAKKGENWATKQDIEKLTRAQESVKSEFAQILEKQRGESQLRLAVVDRRFQAHQEAHTLWLKLVRNAHVGDIGDVVMEAQDWWDKNSLYLDSEVGREFRGATMAAFNHHNLLRGPRNPENNRLVEENWHDIMKVGAMIAAAVDLPKLKLDEKDIHLPGEAVPSARGDNG